MPPRPLGPDTWDALFDFLDPDRQYATGPDRDRTAEARCLEAMRKLTMFFAGRGCADADDLAVETLLRVASKCRDVDVSGHADRIGYFYAVARNVLHESHRSTTREAGVLESFRREVARLQVPEPDAWRQPEAVDRCLRRCLSGLSGRARQLIVRYHAPEGSERAAAHRTLADEFGKSVNALRIEVHRIRKSLLECVSACLAPPAGREGVPGDLRT